MSLPAEAREGREDRDNRDNDNDNGDSRRHGYNGGIVKGSLACEHGEKVVSVV